jgi:hypothetical protein
VLDPIVEMTQPKDGTPRAGQPLDGGAPGTLAANLAQRRIPDFFIVGNPKSGTTALYEILMRHPQIFMPASKEPWFFARELLERPPPRPEGIAQTLDEYMALFDGARPEQRVGEATALYLWSQTAAARIADARPDARIIAILREPASFLESLHLQFVQTYIETESDLGKALALEHDRREGRRVPRYTYWPQALLYSDHVRYVEQLQRYYSVFPPEQVLVIIYDDFRADNDATVRQVLRFLDVDDTISLAAPSAGSGAVSANPTVRPRSQRLNELVHAVSVGRGPASVAIKAVLKSVTPRRLRSRSLRAVQQRVVFAEPKAPDEQLIRELRRRFQGEVVSLSEYLGRDLVTLWGYGSVE